MPLYLIVSKAEWEDHPIYDVNEGFVVRARNKKEARLYVSKHSMGDEDETGWMSNKLSSCQKISPGGVMGEIADMMLEGVLCECCGVYIGDDVGYPMKCEDCRTGGKVQRRKGKRRKNVKKKEA
jgi:hypothetical protein